MQVLEGTIEIVNQTNKRLIENIKKGMKERDWKVPRLAKETGLSASGLYDVISGDNWPGPDNLERIAKALKTSPGALLGTSESVTEKEQELEERLALLNIISDLSREQVHHFLGMIRAEIGPPRSTGNSDPALSEKPQED